MISRISLAATVAIHFAIAAPPLAFGQDRDALAKEVEQLKKQLKEQQARHDAEKKRLEDEVKFLEKLLFKALESKKEARGAPREIRGKITRVDEKGLVRLSIGSDDGVRVGQEFQAYRLEPEPKYLGSVTALEVTAKEAVGRFTPATRGRQVQEGDVVDLRIRDVGPVPGVIDRLRKEREEDQKRIEEVGKRMEAARKRIDAMGDHPFNMPRVSAPVTGTVVEISHSQAAIVFASRHGLKEGQRIVAYRLEPQAVTYGEFEIESIEGKQITGRFVEDRKGPLPRKGDQILLDLEPRWADS
jgi:hypothetical protein